MSAQMLVLGPIRGSAKGAVLKELSPDDSFGRPLAP